MSKKYAQIWVDPQFKKKLKMEALNNEMRLVDYTKIIGEDADDIYKRLRSKRRNDYEFKL